MNFFVTSRGLGKGGDLGGLAGADAHCLALARAAGSTRVMWKAYLSSSGGGTPVHARTRIGPGPWFNFKGVMIASSVETLHANAGMMNAIARPTPSTRPAGSSRVGHSDKDGIDPANGPSWNSTHTSGCAEGRGAGTVGSGGGRGSLYCFALD